MKLVGDLKDKFDAAETKEAKSKVLLDAGVELSDAEIEAVVGGGTNGFAEGIVRGAAESIIRR